MAERATFKPPSEECASGGVCCPWCSFRVCVETMVRREPCGPSCHPDWKEHDYPNRAKRSAKSCGGSTWRDTDTHPRCPPVEVRHA